MDARSVAVAVAILIVVFFCALPATHEALMTVGMPIIVVEILGTRSAMGVSGCPCGVETARWQVVGR